MQDVPPDLSAVLPAPAAWAARGGAGTVPAAGGAYLLLLRLDGALRLDIPTLSAGRLAPGWYAYAGSARGPGGLRARIARHLRPNNRPHWHVDRLTQAAETLLALAYPDGEECALVSALSAQDAFAVPLAGFGSSDCRQCRSHLLRWRKE